MTARLRLVSITPELLDAEVRNYAELASLLGAQVPPEWPDSNWEPHVLDFLRKQFDSQPETIGWSRYVVLPAPEPVLIGSVGAFPGDGGEAEMGYAILRPWQKHGYATEASQALLTLLFHQRVPAVIAHTYPSLPESIRVMQRCGMTFDGMGAEGTVRYRISSPSS